MCDAAALTIHHHHHHVTHSSHSINAIAATYEREPESSSL
jgi:hypothetical protein